MWDEIVFFVWKLCEMQTDPKKKGSAGKVLRKEQWCQESSSSMGFFLRFYRRYNNRWTDPDPVKNSPVRYSRYCQESDDKAVLAVDGKCFLFSGCSASKKRAGSGKTDCETVLIFSGDRFGKIQIPSGQISHCSDQRFRRDNISAGIGISTETSIASYINRCRNNFGFCADSFWCSGSWIGKRIVPDTDCDSGVLLSVSVI